MRAMRSSRLAGDITVPGDKSISHRALMLATLACGRSRIRGLLRGEDIIATANVMQSLGARIKRADDGSGDVSVDGPGLGALLEPDVTLDFGNGGTGARLCTGIVASHQITARFDGDASLRKRPMRRVLDPLKRMGARVEEEGPPGCTPFVIGSQRPLVGMTYRLPVPSAQIKSSILLAGLNARGETTIEEPVACRDHSEKMIEAFEGEVRIETGSHGENRITVPGEQMLRPQSLDVPADPSSAAFPAVAALIVPGSEVCLRNVLMNPLRSGVFDVLRDMGANIALENPRQLGAETVADIFVKASELKAVHGRSAAIPSMIDEIPILAVAMAFADGESIIDGLGELRVKESDRLEAVHNGLSLMGVVSRVEGETLHVTGARPKGGACVPVHLDHRIAMSFLVMGLACEKGAEVDDARTIGTSFPGFADLMRRIGAKMDDD